MSGTDDELFVLLDKLLRRCSISAFLLLSEYYFLFLYLLVTVNTLFVAVATVICRKKLKVGSLGCQ